MDGAAGGQACPRCHARGRPGAPWCNQCYLDLRPAEPEPGAASSLQPPEVAAHPVAAQTVAAQSVAGLTVAGPAGAAPVATLPTAETGPPETGPQKTWPCTTCGTPNPLAEDRCRECGAGFLAALHEQRTPLLVLPVVGDVVSLPTGQRFALAGLVIALVALLTLLLGVVL